MTINRDRLSRTEIEERARDQLRGAAWEGAFDRRVVSHRVGNVWMVHPGADDRVGGPWIYLGARTGVVVFCDFASPGRRLLRALALVVLVVGVLLLISRLYPQQWCGDVVANGNSTRICRDPNVTDPAVVGLGLVVLATMGAFFTEVSGFGFTLKKRVEDVDSIARNSLQLAEELQGVRLRLEETQSDLADTNKRTYQRLEALEMTFKATSEIPHDGTRAGETTTGEAAPTERQVGPVLSRSSSETSEHGPTDGSGAPVETPTSPRQGPWGRQLFVLAEEYNRIRSTMVSGPKRSTQLERVFREMKSEVGLVEASEADCAAMLMDPDRGRRLLAYAFLSRHAMPQSLTLVVEAAYTEDKPFGQYCALRAVSALAKRSSDRIPAALTAKLESIATEAGVGTDRARQVARILAREHGKSSQNV